MMRTALAVFLVVLASACKSSGGAGPSPPPGVTMEPLTVTSNSFATNGAIPVDYTCDGADKSPQLTWSAPPDGTKAFAIVVDDPDAPGGTFTHWVAFNVTGDARTIAEGADPATMGGAQGSNDFKNARYNGPCPPRHELHHYFFRLYALNAPIDARPGDDRSHVDATMSGRVLAQGALMGTFSH
jgi:Raf kinase inhibitor-like YbhB/YbcL family protein